MKNIYFLLLLSNISFSQISENEINKIAREMSENLSNTKIINSEITINRIYSLKRDIISVYDVPEDINLSEIEVKKERIEQLKAFGGDFFYKNKINLVLWFMKKNIMYKNVRINYFELK